MWPNRYWAGRYWPDRYWPIGAEEEAEAEPTRGGWLPQYEKGEREARGLRWKKKRDNTLERMQRAYALAMGEELPGETVQAVAEAVKPHLQDSYDTALPPLAAIDWPAMLRDVQAIEVLLAAYQQALDDEEDAVALLLI